MAEEKEQGDELAPPTTLGSIQVDALGTEDLQQEIEVRRMAFTFPLEVIARLMTNLGKVRTSKKFRDLIISCAAVEFRAAMLRKGVHVTNVQVEVPPAMYNEHHRATAEARLTTVTICDDTERSEAWRLLDGTGPGVRLDIGKGVMLACLLGPRRLESWWLWVNLSGVESPAGTAARVRAVLQSAGLGSAEMISGGQSASGAHTTWIRCSAYREAQYYSYYR